MSVQKNYNINVTGDAIYLLHRSQNLLPFVKKLAMSVRQDIDANGSLEISDLQVHDSSYVYRVWNVSFPLA